jgi:DNA-binding transcriptional MerR regulator
MKASSIDVYVNVMQATRMAAGPEPPWDSDPGANDPGMHDPGMHDRGANDRWTVGALAEELGVTTRTLRFYEAQGLITPARRGGARSYDHRDRARMRLILRGRRFGMSLSEIREIVDMYDGASSSEMRQLHTLLGRLDSIAADLRARQDDLARTLDEVADVARRCRARLDELG